MALPALAVAASTIGNSRALRLKRGWTEPAGLPVWGGTWAKDWKATEMLRGGRFPPNAARHKSYWIKGFESG